MSARSKKEKVNVKGPWLPLPIEVSKSLACASLSPHATKLLLDMVSQLGANAFNNGDLSATFSTMRMRGWTSHETLRAALHELLEAKFLIVTRQGGRRKCSLYAITFWAMHCRDSKKLDIGPGSWGLSDWTKGESRMQEAPKKSDPAVWNRPRKSGHEGSTCLPRKHREPKGGDQSI